MNDTVTDRPVLLDRRVLVTGAGRGLGSALVDELLSRGATRVYAAARNPVPHSDSRVVPLRMDVTEDAQIAAAAASIEDLDLLINNAALGEIDTVVTPEAVERHLRVNTVGLLAVTEAMRPMLARSHGAVLNILSVAAVGALPLMPAYSASKAAALSLTQSLRSLLAVEGIRVYAGLAGPIDTSMVAALQIPKTSPAEVASALLDGVSRGAEEIFPDPLAAGLADAWYAGLPKAVERQNAGYLGTAPDYSIAFTTDRSADEVYQALLDPTLWWEGDFTGDTDTVDAEFTYRDSFDNSSRQRVTELEPGRRAAWRVVESRVAGTEDEPWAGTEITIDVDPGEHGTRVVFVHRGLTNRSAAYEPTAQAWNHIVGTNLRRRVDEPAAV